MKSDDDQFRPQDIDEQIEQLIWSAQEGELQRNGDAQLVQRLQHHYENEKRKDTLQRAWNSIVQRYEEEVLSSVEEWPSQDEQSKLERSGQHRMQYSVHEQATSIISIRKVLPLWRVLASVAVLGLVIGSIALILNQAAVQRNGAPGAGGGGIHSICPPMPTAAPGQPTVTPTLQSGTVAVPCVPPTATPRPTVAPEAMPTIVPVSGSTPTVTPGSGPIPTVAPEPRATPIATAKPGVTPKVVSGSGLTSTATAKPVPLPTVKPNSPRR